MFVRGALTSAACIVILYVLLPIIRVDPVRWSYSIHNAEGHIQFVTRMAAAAIVCVGIGIAVAVRRGPNKLWLGGFAVGLAVTPVIVGLLLLAYVFLTIAP
ncbi:hypothetical protein [Paenibacillus sp. GYB003]|uniref:hypothetical protein n=1 Tax=Paenibacillus sp. GYB003 TaxID=2994392 RepID=UPI002F9624D4